MQVKRMMIDPKDSYFSISGRSSLLGLNRSTYYYEAATESDLNIALMKLIDEEYTQHPFYH